MTCSVQKRKVLRCRCGLSLPCNDCIYSEEWLSRTVQTSQWPDNYGLDGGISSETDLTKYPLRRTVPWTNKAEKERALGNRRGAEAGQGISDPAPAQPGCETQEAQPGVHD